MKNVKVYFTALALSFSFLFNSCTQDEATLPTTQQLLITSPWKIEYYFQGQDLTSQFGNFKLLYSNTGTVAVQKDNETIYGTWNSSVQNDYEIVNMHFSSSDSTITMLGQNWKVVGKTPSTLQFEETNPDVSLHIRKQ